MLGWSGGAIVLDELPVPGRPTNLDNGRAGTYCACSGCGLEIVWTFFLSPVNSLFFSSSLGDSPL